jgi:hypothetical protein
MKLITENKQYNFNNTRTSSFLISGKIRTVTALLIKTNINKLITYER